VLAAFHASLSLVATIKGRREIPAHFDGGYGNITGGWKCVAVVVGAGDDDVGVVRKVGWQGFLSRTACQVSCVELGGRQAKLSGASRRVVQVGVSRGVTHRMSKNDLQRIDAQVKGKVDGRMGVMAEAAERRGGRRERYDPHALADGEPWEGLAPGRAGPILFCASLSAPCCLPSRPHLSPALGAPPFLACTRRALGPACRGPGPSRLLVRRFQRGFGAF
jgi:hypothetical protein